MSKIFVAYLLPSSLDIVNLLEDGLQWVAKGNTKQEAESNLLAHFTTVMKSDSYDEAEIQKVWEQHVSYVAEV